MMNCMLSHRIWCPLSVVILRMSVLDLCIPGMIEDWMIQRRKLHQEGFVLMEIEENIFSSYILQETAAIGEIFNVGKISRQTHQLEEKKHILEG